MEEENQKPHRVSRKVQSGSHWSHGADDGASPGRKCSGKRCRSWAAAAIADCVALCCCPCAVVNLLTLAFVKVPWMIGRKCISRVGRSKKRRKKTKEDGEYDDHKIVVERDGRLTKEEKTTSLKGEDERRISAERVWLELYQIGHLGFGRVSSFTGIH